MYHLMFLVYLSLFVQNFQIVIILALEIDLMDNFFTIPKSLPSRALDFVFLSDYAFSKSSSIPKIFINLTSVHKWFFVSQVFLFRSEMEDGIVKENLILCIEIGINGNESSPIRQQPHKTTLKQTLATNWQFPFPNCNTYLSSIHLNKSI